MIKLIGYILTIPVRILITLFQLFLSLLFVWFIFFASKKTIIQEIKELREEYSDIWRYE